MEFLIFGTIWFWITILVAIGVIIWNLETSLFDDDRDTGGGLKSTAIIIGLILAYYFFGSTEQVSDAFHYVISNPASIFLWFGLYLLIGVVWSGVKWFFFLHDKKNYYLSQKSKGYFSNGGGFTLPTAAQNKYRIITWMHYWPFSALWTVINQPIKRAFKFIYAKIESTFDKISAYVFSDILKEKAEQEAKIAELKKPK